MSDADGKVRGDGAGGHPPAREFLVVGLGGSAGAIGAFKEFFRHVPPQSGIAYVVILHLSPEYESHLAEVIQQATEMPVAQVTQRVRVEPDHVYVIPPNKSLSIREGVLTLSEVTGFEERRAPVDIFFRTLADSHDSRAVSITMSGTGANGSMGLKRIKERGGFVLAQDPEEAEFSEMPRNSIATGLVDYVLPVAQMPAKIIAYREQLSTVQLPVEADDRTMAEERALVEIFTTLRVRTGHDFTNYKRPTVLRRIGRRMGVHEIADLSAYAAYLRAHRDEAQALLKDLLISVTNFFRDTSAFQALNDKVIPLLFEGKGAEDNVRVWVAGCATGEEAYSVAMLLAERAAQLAFPPAIQVFATDLDERAVAQARNGYYTLNDVADVPPERLRQFFVKEGDGFRVHRELREMILFAHHNLIKDPPFSHLDLITCRNLLIYLNRAAQERVVEVLHFALNPGGHLMLGTSESVDGAGDLFTTFDKESHIYQARAVAPRMNLPGLQISPAMRGEGGASGEQATRARPAAEKRASERLSTLELHQRLLELYGPPSVLINEEYEIIHLSERAGRYMQFSGGEPSLNLLQVIRPELRLELRAALLQAAQDGTSVEARGLAVETVGRRATVDIIVRPAPSADSPARGYFLVLFEEAREPSAPPTAHADETIGTAETVARRLEEENARLRAQMRVTIEQYEAQAEEFKAANEELQAMNEELRSTSEELETSKEELQSLNEELHTVNQELKVKVEELSHAADDVQNLMTSTDIGTVFLDRSLRVKLFTPRARDVFNLIPADVGRPLADITSSLAYEGLLDDAESVVERLHTVGREVQSRDGRWHLMRVLPYRTADDRIGGVVITFFDITERKRAEEALRASEERLRLVLESVPDYAIFTLDEGGHILTWNEGAERMFRYAAADVVGRHVELIYTPEDRTRDVCEEEMRRAREQGRAADERWHVRRDGSRFYLSGVLAPLRGASQMGYVKVARELTERQGQEESLRLARHELEQRVRERTGALQELTGELLNEVKERAAAEERVKGLLRQLVTVQEEERRRIARELHDTLGQQLAALQLSIDILKSKMDAEAGVTQETKRMQSIFDQLNSDVDFLAWELRPAALDTLGLNAALQTFVREWSEHFKIEADYHGFGDDARRLPPEVETNLYRILQEALQNVHKHAGASHVSVLLEQREGQAVLIVEDNGQGYDPEAEVSAGSNKGMGVTNMHERASLLGGTLEIESTPGVGTTIFVRVPLNWQAAGDKKR